MCRLPIWVHPQLAAVMGKKGKQKEQVGEALSPSPAEAPSLAVLHAAAGALAGAIARFAVGPLDVLKIRFQVQLEPLGVGAGKAASKYTSMRQALTTIVREEGVQGLWRGTVPGQLLTIPYTAVQFVVLQQCKAAAAQWGVDHRSSTPFISGALAGAAATIASYPFDLLRTTLAAQGEPKVYATMIGAARGIVQQNGLRGLYRGVGVTLLEIMPYAALQFGLYEWFNAAADRARQRQHEEDGSSGKCAPSTTLQHFVCGMAAGTLAKMGTHPLDVAKKRFQVAGLQRSTRYGQRVAMSAVRSLPQVVHDIYTREGLRGLYKGAAPSVLKAAPSAALTFAAYEVILQLLTAHLAGPASSSSGGGVASRRPSAH